MIPLLDLKPQYQSIKEEIRTTIDNVLDKGFFVLGENVTLLEKEIARYCGAQYAVGVASGTDALLLSFKALGLGQDDEVITTPFTFIATVEAIRKTGARVVFADVDSRTFNIDPADIAKKITAETKAIVPVHMYGQMCLMGPILDLAQKHSLKIIEDCAQSIGAVYKNRKAGSIGDLGCFSFFPS
ncbi:MAG: DegT/DnrJ/EryC1/StrS family aminotransferase, partial [Candidatus Omnitrophica bacterium]|nr:DegT/DnrJ/EryC1/StrS family aminotransferase [Candidatus Omnitrophota bacterium]